MPVVDGNALRATTRILKKHFGNLTVDQVLDLALEIMEAQRIAMLPSEVPQIPKKIGQFGE